MAVAGGIWKSAVHVGRNRIAGEWGHNPLTWARADELPGAVCYRGKRGCIETFLSGAGVTRDYRERSGQERTAVAVAEAAAAGYPLAKECFDLYQDRLARSLASIINVLDPDAIVLAGGLSFSADAGTPIVRAMHGDSSGVRGAAWLWPISGICTKLSE